MLKIPQMDATTPSLARFSAPPVIELALGVQFETLHNFRTVHFGSLWKKIQAEFPNFQEQPPLRDLPEQVEGPQVQTLSIDLGENLPLPRLWFLNEPKTELIQVQQNRFVYNWRRQKEDDSYPHYENIREKFVAEFGRFSDFLAAEKIGSVKPTACEITYVNHIVQGSTWANFGEYAKVFSIFDPEHSDSFLPSADSFRFAANYVIPGDNSKPIGRLRATVSPEVRRSDEKKLFVMNMTALGVPSSPDISGVLGFLDTGHKWIVKGFESLTTAQAQKVWGKEDA